MKKPLVTPILRERTPQEQARFEARRQAAGWRCECDGEAGRALCSLPHLTASNGPRCSRPAHVLVTETDGCAAVVCEDCDGSRHTNALVAEFPQTDLFDLIDPTPGDDLMNQTPNHEGEVRAGTLPVPAGFDESTPYAQWSVVECGLCGERSAPAEHAEHGQFDVDHARQAHPGVTRLPLIVWTISRARARTYLGQQLPPTTTATTDEDTQ